MFKWHSLGTKPIWLTNVLHGRAKGIKTSKLMRWPILLTMLNQMNTPLHVNRAHTLVTIVNNAQHLNIIVLMRR